TLNKIMSKCIETSKQELRKEMENADQLNKEEEDAIRDPEDLGSEDSENSEEDDVETDKQKAKQDGETDNFVVYDDNYDSDDVEGEWLPPSPKEKKKAREAKGREKASIPVS